MDTRLTIRHTGKMKTRGEVIEILLGDEIIASGHSPECAACRVLKARGFTGVATFWREGKPTGDMRMSIEWAAGRYVAEDNRQGARFAKWEPNPLFKKPGEAEGDEMEEAA